MDEKRRLDLTPLVVLGVMVFIVMLVVLIPGDQILPAVVYLPFVIVVAAVLYQGGLKPADPGFRPGLFWLAFVVRLIGSLAYFYVIYGVYGQGDANAYFKKGMYVAEYLRRFDLSVLGTVAFNEGSARIAYVTGVVYTVFPPSMLGGSFFFSTLSLIGGAYFYRAFRIAFPDENPGFYRLVVFFLPSLIFWPSAIGKEAWVLFGSGFVAYGLARYARHAALSGLVWTMAGILIVYLPRPHFAAFLILAIGPAYLFFHHTSSARQFLIRMVGMAAIVVLGVYLLRSAGEFLELGDLQQTSVQDITEYYEFRQDVTSQGGSGFVAPNVLSLTGPFAAVVTVLLRPFPWEAGNLQGIVTSAESLLWLGLFWSRRRTLWHRLVNIRRDPWVAFALAYSVIMIMALTTAGNFGIVTRQRVTFLPFLWVLFA